MSIQSYDNRPRPLHDAAARMTKLFGIIGTVVTAAAGWGVLTSVQGDALLGLLGVIPGVITLVTTVLAAFGVVREGEPQVTPLADPRDASMNPLVPRL